MPQGTSASGIYHVVAQGLDQQVLFEERADFEKYLELLEYYKEVCGFSLYAYCLMSNHIHLLIRVGEEPLEQIFRRIHTRYAVWFNMKYSRTGHLFKNRFYSEPVEDERYFRTVVCYILQNPMKAGLEAYPGEKYFWTSYRDMQKKVPWLIDADLIIKTFGGSEPCRKALEENVTEECLEARGSRYRLPDDVAREVMRKITSCENATQFQRLSLSERNRNIKLLREAGLSVRQINRLTGVAKGVIERQCKM